MSGGSFWSSSWDHFNGRSASSSISKKKVREHIAIRVALCAFAWWVAPAQATTVTTLPGGSTLVGSSGGLEFHLIWDSSVSSAPPAFKQAVEAAAAFYTQVYSNAEVINIAVGWGEVDGMPISAGNLAEGVRPGAYLTYAQVMGGLNKHSVNSSVQAKAASTLPSTDPLSAKHYYVPFAQAKTLGYISPTGTEVDGYIGISKTVALSFTQPVAAGQFDAIGAMEHEISAVMGRVGAVGAVYGAGVYTPLDLFRYSAPAVRAALASVKTPYFSINGGVSNLGNYSTISDFGDWNYGLVRGDANGGATVGTTLAMTPNDLIEQAVLGYNFTAAGLAAAKLIG
jgi:hypothetical protein